MAFTNITKSTDPKSDFWKLNPQLQYITPFNKLKDKFKKDSSQYMWAIFFMSEPDEDINKFFRHDLEKRRENINNLYQIKWDDPLFQECLEAYPFECMDSVQRALKDEKDSLRGRARLIANTEYTLDKTDENGKKIIGTATQLDRMRKDTAKIYESLEQALLKFSKQKEDEIRVHGGRKQSASEKGQL